MGKRLIVDSDFLSDFTMIGIACHLNDYRLLFHINKALHFNLRKTENFKSITNKSQSILNFSFAHYTDYENRSEYFLVSNHDEDGLLIPELKQFDFFLIIQGIGNLNISNHFPNGLDDIVHSIRSIPNILAAYEIPVKNIKGIDVLISDIELHMLDMDKYQKSIYS